MTRAPCRYLEIVSTSDMLTAPTAASEGAAVPALDKKKPTKAGECSCCALLFLSPLVSVIRLRFSRAAASFNAHTPLAQELAAIAARCIHWHQHNNENVPLCALTQIATEPPQHAGLHAGGGRWRDTSRAAARGRVMKRTRRALVAAAAAAQRDVKPAQSKQMVRCAKKSSVWMALQRGSGCTRRSVADTTEENVAEKSLNERVAGASRMFAAHTGSLLQLRYGGFFGGYLIGQVCVILCLHGVRVRREGERENGGQRGHGVGEGL